VSTKTTANLGKPVSVNGSDNAAYRLSESGDRMSLNTIRGEGLPKGITIKEVYLRTRSGNIYRLKGFVLSDARSKMAQTRGNQNRRGPALWREWRDSGRRGVRV